MVNISINVCFIISVRNFVTLKQRVCYSVIAAHKLNICRVRSYRLIGFWTINKNCESRKKEVMEDGSGIFVGPITNDLLVIPDKRYISIAQIFVRVCTVYIYI